MSVRCRISPCLDTGGIRSVVVPYANVQLRADDHKFGVNMPVNSISVDAGKCLTQNIRPSFSSSRFIQNCPCDSMAVST